MHKKFPNVSQSLKNQRFSQNVAGEIVKYTGVKRAFSRRKSNVKGLCSETTPETSGKQPEGNSGETAQNVPISGKRTADFRIFRKIMAGHFPAAGKKKNTRERISGGRDPGRRGKRFPKRFLISAQHTETNRGHPGKPRCRSKSVETKAHGAEKGQSHGFLWKYHKK